MQETIKQILMRRDNLSEEEATVLIKDAQEALQEYLANDDLEGAESICQEYFSLEPDYLDELI